MSDICRRCGSIEVVWARTENGKPMLVDKGSYPNGNVVLEPNRLGGGYTAIVLVKAQMPWETRPRTTAHAAYCGKVRPGEPEAKAELAEALTFEEVPLFDSILAVDDGRPTIHYQPKEDLIP